MYNCKNNHKIENKSIKEFVELQKIDESKIISEICRRNNKSKTYKNKMNYCLTCKKKYVHYVNQRIIMSI